MHGSQLTASAHNAGGTQLLRCCGKRFSFLFLHFVVAILLSGAMSLAAIDAGHEGRTEELVWSTGAGKKDTQKPRKQERNNKRLN